MCSKVLHLGSSQGFAALVSYLSFSGMTPILLVVRFIVGPGLALQKKHSSVEVEAERLARAVNALDAKTYISSIAKGPGTLPTASASLFPFCAYLRLDAARLISWQSLRVLSTVAVKLASESGSTFANVSNKYMIEMKALPSLLPRTRTTFCNGWVVYYIYIYCFTHINDY